MNKQPETIQCPVCNMDMSNDWANSKICQHVFATKSLIDGHVHVHGEIHDKNLVGELIDSIKLESGIKLLPDQKGKELDKKEIVFHNRQRIGDMLMFTCGVRDFKKAYPDVKVNVISVAGHIWDHNPNVDRSVIPLPENTVKIGPGSLTNASNRVDWHFANAFRLSMEEKLNIQIPQGESRPDIWLSEDEWNAPRFIKDPYWIICITGEKGWGSKMYPFNKWQEFVNQNPDVKFVQIGAAGDKPPRLQGSNVIDHVGKTENRETGVRDLFKLFLNAEGSIGLVSFHMHLSGALYKPCIVVAGGREPVSFTRYPGHQYLATDGTMECARKACWHCSIDACTNLVIREETMEKKIPKCVDIIPPEELTRALNRYYEGGRLKKDVPSAKPKEFKNIVKGVKPISANEPTPEEGINTYGMKFGGGALTLEDWRFLSGIIKQKKIRSVLEFGAGLSTLLFNDTVPKVTTFETSDGWHDKIKQNNPSCRIVKWDGKNEVKLDRKYELAFVDGPAGGVNREVSTKLASLNSDLVVVHDAGREFEKLWQEVYLKDSFDGPIKGGHRCHLWVRKNPEKKEIQEEQFKVESNVSLEKVISSPIVLSEKDQKTIKFVSTARGWGGCGRSIATIMKSLINQGHKVEFIPFRNKVSCRELKEYIQTYIPTLKVTENYNSIREACDVFMVYGDDYIWEFGKPEMEEAFSNINADRKIMMLNYRRGRVGEIPWTKGWDKYMFLNSTQEKELLNVLPGVNTKVLPPCTELEPFFNVKVDYSNPLRIVRHSSQGDVKFPKNFNEEMKRMVKGREDAEFYFMPGPSFLDVLINMGKIQKVGKTANPAEVASFLARGNLFWYSLPPGYMDMGPRVILEAMACGLPILADNWGGATDRVTPECGWLCNTKEEQSEIIKGLTEKELREKGEASRQRAREEFAPENWIKEILQ